MEARGYIAHRSISEDEYLASGGYGGRGARFRWILTPSGEAAVVSARSSRMARHALSSMRWGTCAECGYVASLDEDGTMGTHKRGGNGFSTCDGAWEPPVPGSVTSTPPKRS